MSQTHLTHYFWTWYDISQGTQNTGDKSLEKPQQVAQNQCSTTTLKCLKEQLIFEELDKPSNVQQENSMLIKTRETINMHTAPYPACWNSDSREEKKLIKNLPHTKA